MMRRTWRGIVGVVALALACQLACAKDDDPVSPIPPDTEHKKVVTMDDSNVFIPRTVTISKGDTIVWYNAGPNASHSTTSGTDGTPDGLWDSGSGGPAFWMRPGQRFVRVFDDTTGTFPYYCEPHWATFNMTGSVIVNP